jgi:hypothetical protein
MPPHIIWNKPSALPGAQEKGFGVSEYSHFGGRLGKGVDDLTLNKSSYVCASTFKFVRNQSFSGFRTPLTTNTMSNEAAVKAQSQAAIIRKSLMINFRFWILRRK